MKKYLVTLIFLLSTNAFASVSDANNVYSPGKLNANSTILGNASGATVTPTGSSTSDSLADLLALGNCLTRNTSGAINLTQTSRLITTATPTTIASTDACNLIRYSAASGNIAQAMPSAALAGTATGFSFSAINEAAQTTLSTVYFTPTTGTIAGQPYYALAPKQSCTFYSVGTTDWKLGAGCTAEPTSIQYTLGAVTPAATYARSATGAASYYSSSGVLSYSATANIPRLEYNQQSLAVKGYLIEPTATNLLTYSGDLTNGAWTKSYSTATDTAITAPDGVSTYKNLSATGTFAAAYQSTLTVTAGDTYCFSCYVKKKDSTKVELVSQTGTGMLGHALFDLNNNASTIRSGAAFTASAAEKIAEDTYRISATIVIQAGATTFRPEIWPFIFDSTNHSPLGVYVWGCQVEKNGVVTSYIPTTSAAVNRDADVLTYNVPFGYSKSTYTFDDLSTQTVSVSAGSNTIPTNLNRRWVRSFILTP